MPTMIGGYSGFGATNTEYLVQFSGPYVLYRTISTAQSMKAELTSISLSSFFRDSADLGTVNFYCNLFVLRTKATNPPQDVAPPDIFNNLTIIPAQFTAQNIQGFDLLWARNPRLNGSELLHYQFTRGEIAAQDGQALLVCVSIGIKQDTGSQGALATGNILSANGFMTPLGGSQALGQAASMPRYDVGLR